MVFPADLLTRLRDDRHLARLGTGARVSFALQVRGGESLAVAVTDGEVTEGRDVEFSIELDEQDWHRLLRAEPEPRTQHVLAFLAPRGSGVVAGDQQSFAQHLHLVRRTVELAAGAAAECAGRPAGRLDGVAGRYVRVEVPNWGRCDVYVETAGSGPPVLLLHTAGADGRQFHGLLGDPRLTSRYQLICFDLPWHGRSNPPTENRSFDYELTTQTYTDCVVTVIEALKLPEAPVIVGVSMAGAAVLEVAALHPHSVAGVVGCQVGPRVAHRHTPWLRNPRVNQVLHVPEWTYGLMSPSSPFEHRDRVWWGYSQSGWSTYERDIAYYSGCWDIDNIAHLFGAHTPPIVLMSGQYDYSVPPAATQELAGRIPAARYRAMPELGHFPHAENPAVFAEHLLWALGEIGAAAESGHRNSA